MARAKGASLAFMAVLSCCVVQAAGGVTIEFLNECEFSVWPGGTQINRMTELDTGQSWTFPLTAGSTGGRFWGRTGCFFNHLCATGQCESCATVGCESIKKCTATMVEYSLNQVSNLDYYNISLVGGFNLPISFIPSNSKCQSIACSGNITVNCPSELRVTNSCMSACSGTSSCPAGTNYTVIFCGAATSSPSAAPSGAGGATIEFLNKCQFPVWPAGTQLIDEGSHVEGGVVQLERGESWTVPVPAGSIAFRMWGRTGCRFCTTAECWGELHCTTGQCKTARNCQGITPAATVVEYRRYADVDSYDISLIGGFNIPISFIPSNSKCQAIACSSNIIANCPAELRVRNACMSACTGDNEGSNCRPSNYSRFFKTQCPQANTDSDDDNAASFKCSAGSNYTVVFCGAAASVAESSAKTNGLLIGITISGALLALAMMVAIAVYWKKFKTKQHLNEDYSTIIHPNPTKSRAFKLKEIMESTQNFNEKIGQGGFGSVFLGKLEGRDIAVKVLSVFSTEGLHQFQNEVDLLSKIYHRNLVSLLGFCNKSKEVMLVYEYMSEGSLRDHLYGSRAEISPLNWKTRLKIALDAAQGLKYLHMGCTPKIIHRDVKTANILLDGNMNGKLADFGLSRISVDGEASYANTAVKGTIGYLDPDYFRTQMLTAKSDVYSFGVVLLEIICGRSPIDANLGEEELNLIEWVKPYVTMDENGSDIEEIIDKRLNGDYDMGSIVKVARLALRCVEGTPSCRPSVSEVVAELKDGITCENENNNTPSPLILEGVGIEQRNLQHGDVQRGMESIPRKMEWADNSSNLPQVGR